MARTEKYREILEVLETAGDREGGAAPTKGNDRREKDKIFFGICQPRAVLKFEQKAYGRARYEKWEKCREPTAKFMASLDISVKGKSVSKEIMTLYRYTRARRARPCWQEGTKARFLSLAKIKRPDERARLNAAYTIYNGARLSRITKDA